MIAIPSAGRNEKERHVLEKRCQFIASLNERPLQFRP